MALKWSRRAQLAPHAASFEEVLAHEHQRLRIPDTTQRAAVLQRAAAAGESTGAEPDAQAADRETRVGENVSAAAGPGGIADVDEPVRPAADAGATASPRANLRERLRVRPAIVGEPPAGADLNIPERDAEATVGTDSSALEGAAEESAFPEFTFPEFTLPESSLDEAPASTDEAPAAPSDEDEAPGKPAPAAIGLALSGGGIRSATFCLGVLQAIAARRRLGLFDYLSTVSGGGYIGGWLTAWIHRAGLETVESELARSAATGAAEPKAVQWLRRYSNYLTPRAGLLSLDALTVTATWLRNVLLNLIVLVGFIAFVLLVPIALFFPATRWLSVHADIAMFSALALGLLSMSSASLNLTLKCRAADGAAPWLLTPAGVICSVIGPGFAAAGLASCWSFFATFRDLDWTAYAERTLLAFLLIVGTAWCAALYVSHRCRQRNAAARAAAARVDGDSAPGTAPDGGQAAVAKAADGIGAAGLVQDAFFYVIATVVAIALGAGLLWIAWHALHDPDAAVPSPAAQIVRVITWGPPSILLCFGICVSIWIGVVGRAYHETSREWWSRTGGLFIMASVGCFVWLELSFYVPSFVRAAWTGARGFDWSKALVSGGWIASLVGALRLALVQNGTKAGRGPGWRSLLAIALTVLFAIGLFVLIATGVHAALDACASLLQQPSANDDYFERMSAWVDGTPPVAPLALAAAAAITLLFAWRVDVNRFSLHNMYKNRIIRCYLGASNARRTPQPFTGFDVSDDVALKDLVTDDGTAAQRPNHIVNTAMNLVQGSELAWQQRKAASFVLTPIYCGFAMAQTQGDQPLATNPLTLPGFCPTDRYASVDPNREDRGFSLGMAVATSGAALSPNMGANSQPALAALMTFFNIRLGRWSPNPVGKRWWQASPRFGLAWLLAELFGYTNERRSFVYLSDGGHFENMGVYELVRRRCLRIVAVDAGADPQRTLADLGNMLRKCRVDFATEIVIDRLDELFASDDSGRCKRGYVTGTIRYPGGAHGNATTGRILIIKPSLYRPPVEAADLYNYASSTAFPQESTADQWFDESQFESYRSLGFALALPALDAFFGGEPPPPAAAAAADVAKAAAAG